jgi:two-component system phosphate regulon sensor histidine kinase PhoR
MWPFRKSETQDDEQPRVRLDEAVTAAALVAALPDPVLLMDAAGIVVAANDQARTVLETNPSGLHVSATIRAPAVLDALAAVMGGEPARQVDLDLRFRVPRSFVANVAAMDGGRGAVIVLRDLTREQQIERMRADFVANASHELRTPLAALSGFIETILGAARHDEAAQAKFLGLMRSQAERMKRLIDDLLSLSRIEMNEHVRPSSTIDLAQVTRHVRDVLSGMAGDMGCEINLRLDGPLNVQGDRDELVQVIQNLTENALKYAGSGKRIDVTGTRVDGHVELAIRDYGPGIAEEHIPRLTERFYRVNVQESRSRGGTGLGLAIVKHILNRHRGRLTITSELGRGSTFTVRLPAF